MHFFEKPRKKHRDIKLITTEKEEIILLTVEMKKISNINE